MLAHTAGVCFVDLDISSATIVVEFDTKRVDELDIAALLSEPSMPAAEPL